MKIALCGLGRAGKEFVKYVLNSSDYELVSVICREESKTAGKTVSDVMGIITPKEINIIKISEITKRNFDVIIDFSNSETTKQLVDVCAKIKTNLVICTTNFTDSDLLKIQEKTVKNDIGVVYAPTLTIGINMLIDFVKKLSALFPEFSFELIERHPKNKAAPTKTAQIIADSIKQDDVPISSIRLDGYIGVHEATATDGNERITIIHETLSRAAFVQGALLAANFILDKKGFYKMRDIFKKMISDIHKVL